MAQLTNHTGKKVMYYLNDLPVHSRCFASTFSMPFFNPPPKNLRLSGGWWYDFLPQLADISVANQLDVALVDGFEQTLDTLLLTAELN